MVPVTKSSGEDPNPRQFFVRFSQRRNGMGEAERREHGQHAEEDIEAYPMQDFEPPPPGKT